MALKILTVAVLSCIWIVAEGQVIPGNEPCAPPENTQVLLSQDNLRFLVVGELHGTAEIPSAFGELVCSILRSGKRLLVGLEFPEVARPVFEDYLASDGTTDDEAQFLEDSQWLSSAQRFPDGRTSLAMLNLVQRLRELRQEGYPLSLTTFVRPRRAEDHTQTPYEGEMATSLQEAAAEKDYDLTLVLVGNVHALKSDATPNRPLAFEPMAMHLPQGSTLSLQAVHAGGEAWNCREDCRVSVEAASSDAATAQVVLGSALSPGYDGILAVGPITASPPIQDARSN